MDRLLARPPGRWLEEQELPSRKPRVKSPRTWRTRKDPFEGVWCDVLGWLEDDPDRFSRAHLRTLQRRVQSWRGIMANKLVYTASEAVVPDTDGMPENAPIVDDPKG